MTPKTRHRPSPAARSPKQGEAVREKATSQIPSRHPTSPRSAKTLAGDPLPPRGHKTTMASDLMLPYPRLDRKLSDRIAQVRDGLPIAELEQVADILLINRDQLAQILGITVRTLQRRAGADGRLGPAASDRLARVRRIHDLATHVLGEKEKASRWMTTASRPLDGQLPLQLLDTDIGTKRVEQELYQIKYSIP